MNNSTYNTGNIRSLEGLKAMECLASAGRPMKSSEIGVPSFVLRRLVAQDLIENPARGIYSMPSQALGDENDVWSQLAAISKLRPQAVFVLDTAAAFHGLTQNMLGHVSVAVPASHSKIKSSTLNGLGVKTYRMRNEAFFTEGVETHLIDGVEVKITSKARTTLDTVRYSGGHVRGGHEFVDLETAYDTFVRFLEVATTADSRELRSLAKTFGMKEAIRDWSYKFKYAVNKGMQS